MMALKKAEREKFRVLLETEITQILGKKTKDLQTFIEENRQLHERVRDEGEKAEARNQAWINISLAKEVIQKHKKIKTALERIARGTFGYCINCSSKISKARLESVPWEPQCIECKNSEELRSKIKSSELAQ